MGISRKCFIRSITVLAFFLIAGTGFSQEINRKESISDGKHPLKVFVIGNSFSRNALTYLPDLAKEGGHNLVIGRALIGGGPLQRHWDFAEISEKNPDDPKGKPYEGKSLKALLSDGIWDIVTIQQYSFHSSDVNTYRPYAQKLVDYIRKLQPNAQIIMHQTWAYRSDSKDFGQTAPGKFTKNQKEMWEKSREAYHTIAKELDVKVIPTGDAFWLMSKKSKWAYKPDVNFDINKAVPPALPNQTYSLNVGYYWVKDKIRFDSRHANVAGCYLGSLVWYAALFGESPKKLTFVPENLSKDFAFQLRKVAWKGVQDFKNTSQSQ